MRTRIPFAALSLSIALAAQANTYLLYPDDARGATTYATRYSFGALAGEMLQQVPAGAIAGVGDTSAGCAIAEVDLFLQDQDASTQENYALVFRTAKVGGAPDQSANGVIAQVGPLLSPLGNGGPAAFLITVSLQTPVTVPCTATYFYGVALSAAPGWSLGLDGLSIHNAYNAPMGSVGANARPSAPILAWQIFDPGSGPIVGTAPTSRVANIGLRCKDAVLAIGNLDPASTRSPGGIDYGLGGLYPAIATAGRTDGLVARITDHANHGGLAVLLLGHGSYGTPTAIAGFGGRLYLNLLAPFVQVGTAPLQGTVYSYAKLTIVAPAVIPAAPGNRICLQALTVDAAFGNPRFTNAVVSVF